MRKAAVVLCFLLLVLPICAQSNPDNRALGIRKLAIAGATHVPPSELAIIEAEIKQGCCGHAETQEIRERIQYAFQERGYFEVRVNRMEVTPVDRHTAPPAVDVAADVSDGQQFRLKVIAFRGNQALPSDQLRQQFRIRDSDIFNVEKIRQGLDDLRRLYASSGYINMTPIPNTEADDAFAVITLTIDVDEGKQFVLGGLLLDGAEPHAGDGAKLLAAWKSMVGKAYDGTKVEEWWQLAATMLPPGSRLEQVLRLKQDQSAATVTGMLEFPEAK